MRKPPPLASLPQHPVTGAVGLLALAVTLLWWGGRDASPLLMNDLAWRGQPWRLVTAALPHVDLAHLAFNLYWLWVFGTLVEEAFGPWKTLGLVLLLAAGSSAAEYAYAVGGVGLSGVGYGLFGLLWVLSRHDERFRGAVDGQTVALFIVWFFLCLWLTAQGVWQVGNMAHASGAALGAMVGLAVTAQGWQRLVAVGLLAAVVVLVLLAASVGRRYVNFSREAGLEFAARAYQEQQEGRDESAVELYRQAPAYDDRQAGWWYNLGIAYQKLDRAEQARDAYGHAVTLEPGEAQFRAALDALGRPAEE